MYWLFCYCYLLLLLAFVIVSVTILNNQQSISIRGIYPYSALGGRGSSINAWYSFLLCFLSLCFNKYLVWYWILYLIPRVSDLLLSVFIIPFSLSLSLSLSLFFSLNLGVFIGFLFQLYVYFYWSFLWTEKKMYCLLLLFFTSCLTVLSLFHAVSSIILKIELSFSSPSYIRFLNFF